MRPLHGWSQGTATPRSVLPPLTATSAPIPPRRRYSAGPERVRRRRPRELRWPTVPLHRALPPARPCPALLCLAANRVRALRGAGSAVGPFPPRASQTAPGRPPWPAGLAPHLSPLPPLAPRLRAPPVPRPGRADDQRRAEVASAAAPVPSLAIRAPQRPCSFAGLRHTKPLTRGTGKPGTPSATTLATPPTLGTPQGTPRAMRSRPWSSSCSSTSCLGPCRRIPRPAVLGPQPQGQVPGALRLPCTTTTTWKPAAAPPSAPGAPVPLSASRSRPRRRKGRE